MYIKQIIAYWYWPLVNWKNIIIEWRRKKTVFLFFRRNFSIKNNEKGKKQKVERKNLWTRSPIINGEKEANIEISKAWVSYTLYSLSKM